MVKILLCGCNGQLGRFIVDAVVGRSDLEIIAGVDINPVKLGNFPVFADPLEFGGNADIVVDCSHHSALSGLLSYCRRKGKPLLICTTGHSDDQLLSIEQTAEVIPIFRSPNMSLGVALLAELSRKTAALLGEQFDVEIIERHHNKKLDAPSGTALMLLDAVQSGLPHATQPIYDRHEVRQARNPREIGMHTVRGGTITGDHTVLFAGTDETIELKHSASSRAVFAAGALKAAVFLIRKPAGLYGMDQLVASLIGG